uniref:U-box domain-containing protein 12 n=1 Tax=Araucaria cunninghamii TaxID=56994 RepID=A0A0D6R5F2_ARACU
MALPLTLQSQRRGFMPPPSELSSMSLLKALLDLAHEVVGFPKPRACQRRNAYTITRRIKVLSLLFEEIRDNRWVALPPSALLCLKEMYVMLQRTRYLMEECKEGSSVWLLMQTEDLSAQFHRLTQDLATTLDVMPLKLMDVSDEVREQLELLHRQARRAGTSLDPTEERLRNDVLAVLEEFEKKVTPDAGKLRRIFDSLEIKDARACRREIQLLEDEIRNQSSSGAEGTVSMINSLIGFMRYCKCVLFGVTEMEAEELEKKSKPGISSQDSENCANLHVPDDFKCPISLDLMRDPVIVATGQTYDRVSITRWIEEGHSTCPKSGQKLLHTNLTPNNALRSLIARWCEQQNISFDKPEKSARNTTLESITTTKAALEATKMTAAFLVEKLGTGSPEVKKQVAYELRLLAKCGMDNRACIAEAGAVPLLLPLLSSDDPKSQENAVTALLNLSIYEANKARIVECGCLDPIIRVLKEGRSMVARENAAATLFSLSVIDEYKQIIGEREDAIPALVDLLGKGTARGKRDAATALFNLSIFRGNDVKAVAAGAVPLLVNCLTDDRPCLLDDALAVLAVLARRDEGLVEIRKTSALPRLVDLLRSASSSRGKENAISVLVALCRKGGNDTVNEVTAFPSLVPSMYTLLTTGTPRAKRKARALFRLLQRRESPAAILHSIIASTTANTFTTLR